MFLYTTTLSIEHHHKSPLFLNTYDFNKETPGIQAQVMLSSIIILHFSSIHNLWSGSFHEYSFGLLASFAQGYRCCIFKTKERLE
uniref:Uncharacterized protein n=1 Tax=Helianthus annuus TaxID=4232 RepID=A0A251SIJ6_HELAN